MFRTLTLASSWTKPSNTVNTMESLVVEPRNQVADWELWLAALPSIMKSVLAHTTSLGEDQNAKVEIWFLLNANHFH